MVLPRCSSSIKCCGAASERERQRGIARDINQNRNIQHLNLFHFCCCCCVLPYNMHIEHIKLWFNSSSSVPFTPTNSVLPIRSFVLFWAKKGRNNHRAATNNVWMRQVCRFTHTHTSTPRLEKKFAVFDAVVKSSSSSPNIRLHGLYEQQLVVQCSVRQSTISMMIILCTLAVV